MSFFPAREDSAIPNTCTQHLVLAERRPFNFFWDPFHYSSEEEWPGATPSNTRTTRPLQQAETIDDLAPMQQAPRSSHIHSAFMTRNGATETAVRGVTRVSQSPCRQWILGHLFF